MNNRTVHSRANNSTTRPQRHRQQATRLFSTEIPGKAIFVFKNVAEPCLIKWAVSLTHLPCEDLPFAPLSFSMFWMTHIPIKRYNKVTSWVAENAKKWGDKMARVGGMKWMQEYARDTNTIASTWNWWARDNDWANVWRNEGSYQLRDASRNGLTPSRTHTHTHTHI